MEILSSYDWLGIMYYLNARDLKALRFSCKRFHRDEDMIMNIAFKHICELRWSESNSNILKVAGAQTWEQGHDIFAWKKRIPTGLYSTPKNVIVFGHGRSMGCEGWVLVAHTHNTKLHNINYPNLLPHIELRICLQNTDNNMLYFQLSNNSFDITDEAQKAMSAGRNFQFHVNKVQLIAKNGHKVTDDISFNVNSKSLLSSHSSSTVSLSSQLSNRSLDTCISSNSVHPWPKTMLKSDESVIALRQYEYIVVSLHVQVLRSVEATAANNLDDEMIEHEIDFFSIARYLKINSLYPSHSATAATTADGFLPHSLPSGKSISTCSLVCQFLDEMDLWEHYIELPGKVILLRRDCNACSAVNSSLRY